MNCNQVIGQFSLRGPDEHDQRTLPIYTNNNFTGTTFPWLGGPSYLSYRILEQPFFQVISLFLHLPLLVRYLHLNPLRAGVVKDLKGLDRYPYTGHSVLVGLIDRSWQDTEDVWSRFGGTRREAAKSYRAFVSDGVGQGRRPDLMGGGLYRSMGGWRAVADLRRGREAYRSDERVLGSSAFVEALLEEADAQLKGRYRQIELPKLKKRIAKDMGVSSHALAGGGRSENVSRARAVLCYVWMHYLGKSGRVLAEELGVSPQAVYAASSRVERDGGLDAEALERWCQ